MVETRIIGIVLVRNEDIFLERVLKNIFDFCDQILIVDHQSDDNTGPIAKTVADKHEKFEYFHIDHPRQSHEMIKEFAGENVWVFAVDGDELYDVKGLRVLRQRILAGNYDEYWMVLGNVLNCVELNNKSNTAVGYLAPPCRSMTKLYNFGAIDSWTGACPERLHGGEIKFKNGYRKDMVFYLYKQVPWENSIFRCLHLCFLVRSSLEKKDTVHLSIRKNIADRNSETIVKKIYYYAIGLLGIQSFSKNKREKYMRGELVTESIEPFID